MLEDVLGRPSLTWPLSQLSPSQQPQTVKTISKEPDNGSRQEAKETGASGHERSICKYRGQLKAQTSKIDRYKWIPASGEHTSCLCFRSSRMLMTCEWQPARRAHRPGKVFDISYWC